jgi:hypothetical protein
MATVTKGKTFINGELVTPAALHQMVDSATVTGIANADIAANAAIADTKLATISTANKVAQSAVANLTTDLAGKAASSHTHTIANVTGLQTALDGKQASGSYAAATHTHAISDTTGLQTALDNKAAASHTHTIANVTGLQTALDGKQASGSYAPATGIAASAITGTAVITTDSRLSDARTPISHTHDDRYYTETEVNSLLAAKQNSLGFTPVQQGGGANQGTNKLFMGWSSDSQLRLQIDSTDFGPNWPINVTGTASGNAPANHNHDDRYYTETEMNTLLAGKQASGSYAPASGIAPSAITGTAVITTDSRLSDARTPTTHTHDDRYYTETEIDTKLSGLPVSGHTHDDRYYTESEMNTLLAGKQASGSYAPASGIAPSAITGTAVITTDSRLSDARTPAAHSHGNITTLGAIGNASGVPIITGTSGLLQAGSFGTAAGTFCQGSDSRLSDPRIPTDNSVTTAKLTDANVTTAKIANAAVTAEKLSGAQTGSAPVFGIRAWAKFAGQGTNGACTVDASGNVTSVSRISSGEYEVVMTTALPNANYAVVAMAVGDVRLSSFTDTTTTFRMDFLNTAGTVVNPTKASFIVIG